MEAEEKSPAGDVSIPKTVDSPRSITKIKKIVIDGFKSFAKYTELLMGDEFNIILGPNGSGKSNVLDALCFVLGKSSSKSLRAEKSANLIYNGGKTKKPAKQAEVSIWLDNSNGVFPVQDDEVKISRIVRQNGSSKYKINNKACTRYEILELLSSVKINPDAYNIILQGDITKLIEMSPVERRQIIEEIAGIGVYEEKKQQALNELAKVEDKLNEAEIILKEREGYLKDLRKDRDHALKHKDLTDKIKQNKASLCKVQIEKHNSDIKRLEKSISSHQEKLDKVNSVIEGLKKDISERKKKIDELNDEIEAKSEKEQSDIQKQVENLRVNIATKKAAIAGAEKDGVKALERIQQLEQNLKSLEGRTGSLLEKKAGLDAQRSALRKTLDELESKIAAFRKKHNIEDISKFEVEIEKIEKVIDEKQKVIEDLRVKQQNVLREKDRVDFQIQTVEDKIKEIAALKEDYKDELKALEQKRKEFSKVAKELNVLLDEDSKNASRLGDLRRNINEVQEKLAKLRVKQAAVTEQAQSSIAVKKVIENKNKLRGVFGTISDLGSVDEKFSLALEVAAANKMHSIVTEDDKAAAACINFLKDNKFGVATFLPLNKIKKNSDKDSGLKKIDGVFDWAIDLISFDPRFGNAFSHVFGSTLVVKDLSVARKVGIGKVRMVTLSGDLVERSGAMTGGHRNRKAGAFKEKGLEKDISDLEAELASLQGELDSLVDSRQSVEEKIIRLRELKANLEGDIIKAEKSLHLDSSEFKDSESYKKELLANADQLAKDLNKVEDDISEVMSELTKLKIEKQEIKNRLTSLRSPVVLAELNAFEEKRKELTTQLIKVEGEIDNVNIQIKEILGKDKDDTIKLIADLKKEHNQFNRLKLELEKDIKALESELRKKEDEQAKFMAQFKGLFEKRNRLNSEVSAFENKLYKVEETSRKEEISVNTLRVEQERLRSELKSLEVEFEQFEGVELVDKPEEQLKREITNWERSLALIGNVNLRALEIYETVEKEYNSLVEKKNSLSDEKKSVLELMDEIEVNKKELFVSTLKAIDSNFRKNFSKLTTKGVAFLELENPESPFEAGLRIKVKLTGEKFLDLRSLSGGEKTLTALAFLFSIQEHEPAPFYILDEVDAALDKANSEKLAKLIREYCKKAQYIVISHNDSIISEGDVLYGISMKPETGISSAVSVRMS